MALRSNEIPDRHMSGRRIMSRVIGHRNSSGIVGLLVEVLLVMLLMAMMERRGWLMAGVWRTMENSRAGCWGNCGCEQDTMSFGLDQQDVWQDWKMIHVAPKGFVILKCGGEAGHVCGNPRPRERKKMPPASLNRTASGGPNPPGDKTKPAAKQIKVRAGSRMSGNFLIHSPGYVLYPKVAIDIYVELFVGILEDLRDPGFIIWTLLGRPSGHGRDISTHCDYDFLRIGNYHRQISHPVNSNQPPS